MKNRMKRWLALSLSASMLLSLAACGSNVQTGTTAEDGTDTTVAGGEANEGGTWDKLDRISLYPDDAQTASGVVEGYKADILAEHGLEMEIWAFSNEKTNAILASGELPDVMFVKYDNYITMLESGMILNLEEHLDKLPRIQENERAQAALNYTRRYRSADTGQLYGIPIRIGQEEDKFRDTQRNCIKVNWDVYYEMGCPEVKTVDDLIPLMKDMMAHQPEAEDGTKTWGTILNSGSDTNYWGCMQLWYKWFGYEPADNLEYLLETDVINNEYTNILEAGKDSLYYKGLKWYNTAYREGVLDPDSINNERELGKAKVETSLACMIPSGTLAGWTNYKPIYLEGQKLMQENWKRPYGSDTYVVISSKTKNVDAALRAINFLADMDVKFEIHCGPEGGLWEYDEDGKVVPTQYGLETAINQEIPLLPNGEKRVHFLDSTILDITYANSYIGPEGPRHARGLSEWPEVLEVTLNTEEENQWREAFGYENFNALLKDKGGFNLTSEIFGISGFCADPTDDQKLILEAIRTTIVDASWKMVYANDDAEFDALWEAAMNDCRDLGAQELAEWRLEELEKALEIKRGLES